MLGDLLYPHSSILLPLEEKEGQIILKQGGLCPNLPVIPTVLSPKWRKDSVVKEGLTFNVID